MLKGNIALYIALYINHLDKSILNKKYFLLAEFMYTGKIVVLKRNFSLPEINQQHLPHPGGEPRAPPARPAPPAPPGGRAPGGGERAPPRQVRVVEWGPPALARHHPSHCGSHPR